MDENDKGVMVDVPHDSRIDRHPMADAFVVDGQHLFVRAGQKVIAAYAPGNWRRVKKGASTSWHG